MGHRKINCLLLFSILAVALNLSCFVFAEERQTPDGLHFFVQSKWKVDLYGFIESDIVPDSTRSFADFAGNTAIARPGTFAGDHGRLTFGVRNSRIGLKINAPEVDKIKTSGVFEMDFLGNQPPSVSEGAFFTSPTFRIRHATLKITTPSVDILAGQSWELFGWQPYFHPNTVEIQGVPGQIYSRTPQLRLSHLFKTDPVNVEVAVAASRPPQRNAFVPDGQGGIRLLFNNRKGMHTAGATGTAVDAMAIGVSGAVRRFSVPAFSATPTNSVAKVGWGIDADVMVPIIAAQSPDDCSNALTFTGSYVRGSGISDLYTALSGGMSFPALPGGGAYASDIDNGLVTFDTSGGLHTIDWQSFILGLQYYFPQSGRVWVSTNYSQMNSGNASAFATSTTGVFNQSRWADVNLFWDITKAVRGGIEYAWFNQKYVDGVKANNHRGQFSLFYLF